MALKDDSKKHKNIEAAHLIPQDSRQRKGTPGCGI